MPDILTSLKQNLGVSFSDKNAFSDPEGMDAFSEIKKELPEAKKWSDKYKKSINCSNPKGFSQKAYCQGKKKKSETREATGTGSSGSFTGPMAFSDSDFVRRSNVENKKGLTSESKNVCKVCKKTNSNCTCRKKTETKEATGSGSSGSYLTPAAWAKSMNKKDWRGRSKTQIPGGKFVTIKKKCKKFPYCNQGDIKALKIYENEVVKKVINKISKEHSISENVIKAVIQYEIEKYKNNSIK